MPPTTAATEPCRVHRFTSDMVGLAIGAPFICEAGHRHEPQRKLYFCARPGCPFTMSMPMDLHW